MGLVEAVSSSPFISVNWVQLSLKCELFFIFWLGSPIYAFSNVSSILDYIKQIVQTRWMNVVIMCDHIVFIKTTVLLFMNPYFFRKQVSLFPFFFFSFFATNIITFALICQLNLLILCKWLFILMSNGFYVDMQRLTYVLGLQVIY